MTEDKCDVQTTEFLQTDLRTIEMMNRITRRRFIGADDAAIGGALDGCAAPPPKSV